MKADGKMFNVYDKIRLKTGEIASIIEIFDPTSFLVELSGQDGSLQAPEIKLSDIKSRFVEYEEPVQLKRKTAKLGGWEGRITMSDDFDDPIEDFKDYM